MHIEYTGRYHIEGEKIMDMDEQTYNLVIDKFGTQLIDILIYERGVGFSFLNNDYILLHA